MRVREKSLIARTTFARSLDACAVCVQKWQKTAKLTHRAALRMFGSARPRSALHACSGVCPILIPGSSPLGTDLGQ
ncbi:hypothetical protein BaRGS_00007296, partial [Batillaria attramentaria]